MEAKAALECVERVWLHSQISAFMDLICTYDDSTTKAYLTHSFANLDALERPSPTNKKGEPRKSKKEDKERLLKHHAAIEFLSGLCHQVQTFGKYLWALLK